MSKLNNTQKFTAAAAFGAAAIFSMLSFGSSAEAAINLSSCGGNTAGKAASCCERLTVAQSPLWMIQSRTSCREAVVCGGRASSNEGRCRIRIRYFVKEGGGVEGNDGGDN
jgi:hypothetical protein